MDELHTVSIGAVPKSTSEDTQKDELDEIIDINTMYINICSYIKCKIDHNTYTTNIIKGSRISNILFS